MATGKIKKNTAKKTHIKDKVAEIANTFEWLITAFVKEGQFEVIERRLLEKVLSEQKLVMTGVVSDESATELGKLLGVRMIVTGSVVKFRDFMEVNARIIDVESASIVTADRVKGTTVSELQALVVKMAASLTHPTDSVGFDVEFKLTIIDPLIEKITRLKLAKDTQWKVEYREALRVLNLIYIQYPRSSLVYYYYAQVNAAGGDIARANRNLDKAVYYDPEYKAAFILKGDMNFAWARKIPLTSFMGETKRRKLGGIIKAAYDSAASLEQNVHAKAKIYFKIGNLYDELSDAKEKARNYWQKAVTMAPGSQAARLAEKKLKEK